MRGHLRPRLLKITMKTQYIFGDYVLSAAPNAFNKKTSWWISKRHHTRAFYAFSTEGNEAAQQKEVDCQVKCIDCYIKLFDNSINPKEA